MPRGNGTGPMGMGPMTGRGMGFCAGYDVAGFTNPAFGRGCGMGFGRGRGMGFRRGGGFGLMRLGMNPIAYQEQRPEPELEKQSLRNYTKTLESELEAAKKRLDEIEKSS
ncbi:MAG TPA: hypothetical protein DET40_10665 [Lentisphaeria bacterium]|nr:MAG: hypothetical protein A2X45_09610 [Lentisphaerae bacterium GWF2_50_93]HCE44000.1 hypothetical protein [Lentisphaeria bacterium]